MPRNDRYKGSISDAVGREQGSEPDGANGIEDVNRESNLDDQYNGGDADSASGIGVIEIDPESLSGYIASSGDDSGDGSKPRKQRKKRGPNKPKSGSKKASETVAPFITFIHNMMAMRIPELALDETEAQQLSDVYSSFCEHHDIPVMSDKRISEINLVTAICTIYGTRAFAIRNRLREESAAKKARPIPVQVI